MDDHLTLLSDGPTLSGSVLSGTQTPILTITGIDTPDEGEYVLWAAAPGEELAPVETTILYIDRDLPTITSMPQSREGCIGGTTTFSIDTNGATSYQWYWNGEALSSDGQLPDAPDTIATGTATNELVLSNLVADAFGFVDCTVFGPDIEFRNSIYAVQLGVSDNALPPTIASQPGSVHAPANGIVTFAVEAGPATKDGIVSYQWRRDGKPLTDGGGIYGSQWPTLEIEYVSCANQGNYDCVVSQACGSTTTNTAILTVAGCTPGDIASPYGVVNVFDILALLSAWGDCSEPCPPSDACPADITNSDDSGTDCSVNVFDLVMLLSNWTS
jgi:hypothetical protein